MTALWDADRGPPNNLVGQTPREVELDMAEFVVTYVDVGHGHATLIKVPRPICARRRVPSPEPAGAELLGQASSL